METFLTVLGFKVLPVLNVSFLSLATLGHILETMSWIKIYSLSCYISLIFILLTLHKDHIGVLLRKIRNIDFHGLLLICIFQMV